MKQLEKLVDDADGDAALTIAEVGQVLRGADFPVLSTGNAFEKYWDKFLPFPIPMPFPVPPPALPTVPQQRPSACEVYARTFGPPAADCACRAYIEARREGLTEYQAVIIGHFAGRRGERTGVCPV